MFTGLSLPSCRRARRRTRLTAVLLAALALSPGAAAAQADPPAEPRFRLQAIRLEGSTLLGRDDVAALAAPWLGREIGATEVEEIRRAATELYLARGRITSGVVVPDQDVGAGVLTLRAVEGRVTEVEVTGTRGFRPWFFTSRLRAALAPPVDIAALERRQQVMLRDPLIRRLDLALEPGAVPGEARLVARVEEAQRLAVDFVFANSQSNAVGELRGGLVAQWANPLGLGDVLTVGAGVSGGIGDQAVAYSVPVWPDDTRLTLRYDRNRVAVVDPALRDLDIESRYDSWSAALSRPVLRTPTETLTLAAGLELRQSRSYLGGEPFDFTLGTEQGRARVTALRLSQDWLDRDDRRVVAARSTFSIGLDAFNATQPEAGPGAGFLAWLGQAQYVRRTVWESEVLLRGALQLSDSHLFPMEQFVLGGMNTVRGYPEARLAADNAAAGTIEWRVPVARLPAPWAEPGGAVGTIQLAPFLDWGTAWNSGRETPRPSITDLLSAGVGARWQLADRLFGEIYFGQALRDRPQGNSWQQRGIHFRLAGALF